MSVRTVDKMQTLRKMGVLLLAISLIFSGLTGYVCAAPDTSCAVFPDPEAWAEDYNWTGNSYMKIKGKTVILHNQDSYHFAIMQEMQSTSLKNGIFTISSLTICLM